MMTRWLTLFALLSLLYSASAQERGAPWKLHTIDNSSRGADGIRSADVNGDGLPDLVTGWEEGHKVRVCINPGPKKARKEWPSVTVGEVRAPEDAVFADLDGDGAVDVVSCCEGSNRSVYVHWAPKDKKRYLEASAWKTEAFPAVKGKAGWMFCLPMQIDGKHGIDLIIGAKKEGAEIGWLEAPANPRNLADWKYHPLYQAGWIMSLVPHDMDGDGDLDIVASDRKGANRGCLWLENPGAKNALGQWAVHRIGPGDHQYMFLDVADLDGDKLDDVIVITSGKGIVFYRRKPGKKIDWERHLIRMPANTGSGKAIRVVDINQDGRLDLVFSCENSGKKTGVGWLSYNKSVFDEEWAAHEISGPIGIKYDVIGLFDLDKDGDLDVVSTEERTPLGVIWYENPTK